MSLNTLAGDSRLSPFLTVPWLRLTLLEPPYILMYPRVAYLTVPAQGCVHAAYKECFLMTLAATRAGGSCPGCNDQPIAGHCLLSLTVPTAEGHATGMDGKIVSPHGPRRRTGSIFMSRSHTRITHRAIQASFSPYFMARLRGGVINQFWPDHHHGQRKEEQRTNSGRTGDSGREGEG